MESKREQLQQELIRLNRLRKNVKKELKNLDSFVGKWWTHGSGDIVFITHEGDSGSLYGYGIDGFGNCFYRTNTGGFTCALNGVYKKYTRESTKEEIEEALIKEAENRGLEGSFRIKEPIHSDFTLEICSGGRYSYDCASDTLFYGGVVIYCKGVWAEAIEQDKFSELKEAHKNGAIIQYKVGGDGWWDCIHNKPFWDTDREYRVKPEEKPKVGDVCKFWNYGENNFEIAKLVRVYPKTETYKYASGASSWINARTLTKQEVIDLLFKD